LTAAPAESRCRAARGYRAAIIQSEVNEVHMRLRAVLGLLLLLPAWAWSMPALVDGDWLAANRGQPDLVVLDIQEAKDYQRYHVPGAVNAPYGKWRTDSEAGTGSMRPPVSRLEALIGGLGIAPDSRVVIVATGRGAGDLAAAARVYWTFQTLGHRDVAVLDGGLVAYAQARHPLENGSNRPQPVAYAAPAPDAASAPDAAAVAGLLERKGQFVDARSEGEYVGLYRGDEAERHGTIPGASSLPYDWVTEEGSARLRDPDALRALFAARGIDPAGTQVHFCHSGNRAALTWFAANAVLGNRDAVLYDGSMMEWARNADLPVERKIQLCSTC
jgi:thiosulfate/3-mercaptopyruvate sulfurtransferase